MSVCVYSVFVLFCVRQRPCDGLIPRPRNHTDCVKIKKYSLESWIRIPLNSCMSVCVYFVFVLFYVLVAASLRADLPSKESYRLSKIKKLK
jgi:hypothetical protein